jgi:hypothetical protein
MISYYGLEQQCFKDGVVIQLRKRFTTREHRAEQRDFNFLNLCVNSVSCGGELYFFLF